MPGVSVLFMLEPEIQHHYALCLGPVYMVSGTQDNPPPSYPGRAIFSLISLKSSINRLHQVGETTRVGETRLGR